MSSPNRNNITRRQQQAHVENNITRRPQQEARIEEGVSRFDDQHRYTSDEHPRGRPTPQPHHRPFLPPVFSRRTDHGVPRPYNAASASIERRAAALRARAISERFDEQRYRHTANNRSSNGPRDLHRVASQLDAASTTLRALLDDPIPAMSPPGLPSQSTVNDSASESEESRRFKRRKLDTDKQPEDYKGFSYGYYGQVAPGQLRMEIVSCDGGSFESDSNRHSVYAAENVLRDDRSVYCTKANRCNLILRHQGATPFCLEELVIKAPPRGYTAP